MVTEIENPPQKYISIFLSRLNLNLNMILTTDTDSFPLPETTGTPAINLI